MIERRRYREELVTCSQCGQHWPVQYTTLLDGKPFCSKCWDTFKYEPLRRACRERGHHITSGSVFGSGDKFYKVSCECGAEAIVPWEGSRRCVAVKTFPLGAP